MKILINALSGIGDALMFSPLLKLIKKHRPESQIDMLVMFKGVKDIYESNPYLNKIYFIDFLNQTKLKSLTQTLKLRANKYNASINVYPSNRKEYNLVQFTEGAKLKIAHRYNNYSKQNWDFLNDKLILEVKNKHNVLENFELIKTIIPEANENEIGKLEIFINDEDRLFADSYIGKQNLENKLLVGFHAGSATFKGHINKRWDYEKFAALAKLLKEKYNSAAILFGTENDLNNKIMALSQGTAFIPETKNLKQTIALMNKCKLFVSNDSALMHIAAALGIKQVAVFGYTNFNELHPWKNEHIIVRKELDCSPCFFNSPKPVNCIFEGTSKYKCIKTISVSEVYEACCNLLDKYKT